MKIFKILTKVFAKMLNISNIKPLKIVLVIFILEVSHVIENKFLINLKHIL